MIKTNWVIFTKWSPSIPQVLSRAFRNRFVELHFDELPSAELETILHQRCSLPPSYCTKLVKVMQDLQVTVYSCMLLNIGQIVVTLWTLDLFCSFFNFSINLSRVTTCLSRHAVYCCFQNNLGYSEIPACCMWVYYTWFRTVFMKNSFVQFVVFNTG